MQFNSIYIVEIWTTFQKNVVVAGEKADSVKFFPFDLSDGLSIIKDVGLDAF